MADARAKAVAGELADLWSRSSYVVDKVTDMTGMAGAGDLIQIPDISALTVNSTGASSMTIESITTNVLDLNVNLEPAICASFPLTARVQLLDGQWAAQVARQAAMQLKNSIDNSLCRDYLGETLCWTTGTANTYHVNVAGDALTEDDFGNAFATLLSTDGTLLQNLAVFVSPFGMGSLASIAGYVAQQPAVDGAIGLPKIGSVNGVPVYQTNSIRRNKSVATTSVDVASNVATATVAAGHGFTAGMRITWAGLTGAASNTAAVTITSTTATTIVAPYTNADATPLADSVGTITDATSWNLVMDVSGIYAAQQVMPTVRIVPHQQQTSDILQVFALWGRVGRAGKVVVMHSPGSAVS